VATPRSATSPRHRDVPVLADPIIAVGGGFENRAPTALRKVVLAPPLPVDGPLQTVAVDG
jgi:hypothetical protein